MKIEYTIMRRGECDSIAKLPAGATIDAVDDIPCIGVCEACGDPILEGERMFTDEEGIELCGSCYDEMIKGGTNGQS